MDCWISWYRGPLNVLLNVRFAVFCAFKSHWWQFNSLSEFSAPCGKNVITEIGYRDSKVSYSRCWYTCVCVCYNRTNPTVYKNLQSSWTSEISGNSILKSSHLDCFQPGQSLTGPNSNLWGERGGSYGSLKEEQRMSQWAFFLVPTCFGKIFVKPHRALWLVSGSIRFVTSEEIWLACFECDRQEARPVTFLIFVILLFSKDLIPNVPSPMSVYIMDFWVHLWLAINACRLASLAFSCFFVPIWEGGTSWDIYWS